MSAQPPLVLTHARARSGSMGHPTPASPDPPASMFFGRSENAWRPACTRPWRSKRTFLIWFDMMAADASRPAMRPVHYRLVMSIEPRSTFSAPWRASVLSAAICAALAPGAWAQQAPAAAASAPAEAADQGLQVRSVNVQDVNGNPIANAREVLNLVRTEPGQTYSSDLLNVDLRTISSLDRFVTVVARVERVRDPATGVFTGVNITFVVQERTLVTAVQISGNRAFKDDQVRPGLTMHPGSPVDSFAVDQDRKFILDKYHKAGYAQASVDVDDVLLARQGIVRYQIIEGPKTHVNRVEIDGNHALSSSYIKWRIDTKSYLWILQKGLLDTDKLESDVAKIREMYLKKGYLDARVSYTLDYSEDKTKVTVRFIVLEGAQYRIGKINLTGNTVFSNAELLGDTSRFGPGSVAEQDKIDALRKHIEDAYGHEGYVDRTAEISTAFTETPGVVDLNIHVVEGSPYIVGRIIIEGNANVQDRVIRRQMRIYPDQTFDIVQVAKSVDRLKAIGIFQDVKVNHIAPPGTPAGVQDALVEVAEGQTGKFSIGAGISTNSGLVGQISVEQQNFDITNFPHSFDEFIRGQSFKGAGQYFQLLLEPGTEFQRYMVTFREPYLFDSPYSFSNDLYYFTRARESWDERRIGDIVTLGRRFGDVWALSLAFKAEDVTLSGAQDIFDDRITQAHQPIFGPGGNVTYFNDTAQEILDEEGSHFLTSIKPGIVRDTTDSRTFPTAGTRTSLTLEQYGAMGGEVSMTKIVGSFDAFITLYTDLFDRKTVLALKNEVGVIPFGKSPTYERFYLGGIGELRGFQFRGVSPRDGPLEDPIGGDFYWMSTAEVNYPIYEELLRGVVFVDLGSVERTITLDSVRSDAGLGVRVTLPLFGGLPIAVDFAYPITKQSTDRTQFVSVSLGVPF